MTMTTETKYVQEINESATIIDILDRFDFEKVHKYMDSVEWTWARCGALVVPSVEDLRNVAEDLLWTALNQARNEKYKSNVVGTGGFYVTYNIFNNQECLKLFFSLETKGSY
jgi:hypothetical protein